MTGHHYAPPTPSPTETAPTPTTGVVTPTPSILPQTGISDGGTQWLFVVAALLIGAGVAMVFRGRRHRAH